MKRLILCTAAIALMSTSVFATEPIKGSVLKGQIAEVNSGLKEEILLKEEGVNLALEKDLVDTAPPKSAICWIAWVFGKYCVD